MPSARPVRSFVLAFALAAWALGACAQGSRVIDGAGGSTAGSTGDPGEPAGLCALQDCHADTDCSGCSSGRILCLLAERRCAACDPALSGGCAEGEICSSFGTCITEGQSCATDAGGEPMISCASSADCAACDLQHQICEPGTGRCVACSTAESGACTATELCVKGRCAPRCPASCEADSDCDSCGAPGHEAHACNAGKCAQCSETLPCGPGMSCSALGLCSPTNGPSGSGSSGVASSGAGAGDPGGAGGSDPAGAGGSDPAGAGGSDPVGAGGGGPGGGCHDICAAGDAMDTSCDPCAETLCAADAYCCSTAWDSLCVSEVDGLCNNACSGAGGGCAHAECAQGDALDPSCSDCAGAVCAADDYCCSTSWDSFCVGEVDTYCASPCP